MAAQPTGDSPQPTFASILYDSTPNEDNTEPMVLNPITEYEGEIALIYSDKEVEYLCIPLRYTLVGKFNLGCRPSMREIRKAVLAVGIKSEVKTGWMDTISRHVLLRFNNADDFHRCWLKPQWYAGRFPMKVMKWTPEFTFGKETPFAPVWISVHSAPADYYNHRAIFDISSQFGVPMMEDGPTEALSRPSKIRFCVQFDLTKEHPARIKLDSQQKSYWCDVEYESVPSYCKICAQIGHDEDHCKRNKNHQLRRQPRSTQNVKEQQPAQKAHKSWKPKPVDLSSTDSAANHSSGTATEEIIESEPLGDSIFDTLTEFDLFYKCC